MPADAWSDAELTRLALAADPDAPIDADAVPFGVDAPSLLLPEWYMPAPQASASTRSRGRVVTVGAIIAALVVVNGVGLCVTYGIPEIAW